MNINSHTNIFKLEEENEKPHHSPAQNASESRTTQVALESLDRQRELVSEEIKKILLTLSPETDRAELKNKIKNLVQQIKTLNPNEEMQENLNHLQISLYKFKFEELSHAIRDVRPFMWNDLPEEMHVYILSQMSFKELLKLHPSKEFRDVVDLEIIERINRNKISLDLDKKTFAILLRALKNQGTHLKYLGLMGGKCSLRELNEIITSCPNLEHIKLGYFQRIPQMADAHAMILAKLAEKSMLSLLKKLEFQPGSIGLEGVKAIAKAPLSTLISLNLVGNELGNQGFACICQSSTLINLKVLDFSTNQMTSEGLQPLGEAKFKLQELYLRNNQIVSFVNHSEPLQDLKILDLSENQMSPDAIKLIFKLCEQALTVLDLSHNHLTDESLPQIELLKASKLKVLKFTDNNISSQGIEKIILLIPQLTGLYLDNNKELDSWGLRLILKEKPQLSELGLSKTGIGEECIINIFDFKNFSLLRKLNIEQIELSDKFWTYVRGLNFKQQHSGLNLKELALSYHENDQEKIRSLLESFPLKRLRIFIPLEKLLGNIEGQPIDHLGLPYGCEISINIEN